MPPERDEAFAVEDGRLIRKVVPARGKPYEHTCTIDSYEAVADAIDQFRGSPFTIGEIHERTGLPWTQVNVALAFLKDRGCIVPARNRRHKAAPGNAPDGVLIDAMIEYHALAEKGPADEAFGYETPGPEPAEG